MPSSLAVVIAIGAAFRAIVGRLVEDLINLIISVMIGGIDLSNLFVVLSFDRQPSLEDAGGPVLALGMFINATTKVLIVAMRCSCFCAF